MGLGGWLRRVFGRKSRGEIPVVTGRFTDKDGHTHTIYRGPLQHGSLSPDQLRRVGRLREVLVEAYPMTLDGWVDGFMRDSDPESEIQIIEACAAVYQSLASAAPLTTQEKKRLYSELCVLSAGGGGPEIESALPAGRGLPDLERIASLYREARQSVARP